MTRLLGFSENDSFLQHLHKNGNAAQPDHMMRTSNCQQGQYLANVAGGVGFSILKYSFYRLCPSVVIQQNHHYLCSSIGHFSFNASIKRIKCSRQRALVMILGWFKQFILNYIHRSPPNYYHCRTYRTVKCIFSFAAVLI